MKRTARIAIMIAAGATLLGLTSCREAEQDRPLVYHKGEYGGRVDSALTDAERQELRERALRQQG